MHTTLRSYMGDEVEILGLRASAGPKSDKDD
jgi:hypothetical protein